jgi:D-glycero-D-manno-heptose 1,7-bisphosphate phosphatase
LSVVQLRRALFVDLDGTVRETLSGRYSPLDPEDQVVLPGVAARLTEYRERGYFVVGVTNQAGVAFGDLSEADVVAINARLSDLLLPCLFGDILYCPHHPQGWRSGYRVRCEARKPGAGMALTAAARHGLALGESLMVGDREVDRGFAQAAGIPEFHWAWDFFARARPRQFA